MSEPTPHARKHPSVRNRPLGEVFASWTPEQIQARFWAKVNKDAPVPPHCPDLGPCWLWTGDHQTNGYGLLRRVGAHRVAMWLADGEEPGDRHVLHHCDNPPCVRRSHLHYGTHQRNMAEMAERGRAAKPGLKLTDAQTDELRRRYLAGEHHAALAAEFGISQSHFHRIIGGATRGLPPVDAPWRASGFRRAGQKLSPDDMAEIRRRFTAGESNKSLSIAFGVGTGHVSYIVNGRPPRNRRKVNRQDVA